VVIAALAREELLTMSDHIRAGLPIYPAQRQHGDQDGRDLVEGNLFLQRSASRVRPVLVALLPWLVSLLLIGSGAAIYRYISRPVCGTAAPAMAPCRPTPLCKPPPTDPR
jgi:hypothetical protein